MRKIVIDGSIPPASSALPMAMDGARDNGKRIGSRHPARGDAARKLEMERRSTVWTGLGIPLVELHDANMNRTSADVARRSGLSCARPAGEARIGTIERTSSLHRGGARIEIKESRAPHDSHVRRERVERR